MTEFLNPLVRGEEVVILDVDGEKRTGVLGASISDANVLVYYPDGEKGYVRMSDIQEGIPDEEPAA